jgi:hypothetical protein
LERPAFYTVVGFEDEGALVLKHRMPGRMLKPLVRDVPRCVFTSGTLQVNGRFDHFVRCLGLQAIAPESRHLDPAQHGKLKVEVATETLTHEAMAQRIAQAPGVLLDLSTVQSNIVIFRCAEGAPDAATVVARAKAQGVMVSAFAARTVRLASARRSVPLWCATEVRMV